MAFHLISFLGTNLYEPVLYYTGEKPQNPQPQDEEEFVQAALIKQFREEISNGGKVSLLITDEACEKNWENGTYAFVPARGWTDAHISKIEKGAPKQGLKEYLEKNAPDIFEHDPKVAIKNAKTEDEIWELFDTIYQCINDGDEIVFDITHSFRSIPMLAITVINYAKVMKHCTLKGIYYGAYEASEEVNGVKCAPILNLTSYNEILEWTNAANAFMQQGTVAMMKQILNEKKRYGQKADRDRLKPIDKTVDAVYMLSNALVTNRGIDAAQTNGKKADANRSIINAYDAMVERVRAFDENQLPPEQRPIFYLLEKAVSGYDAFFAPEAGQEKRTEWEIGCGAVEWGIRYNMAQQGLTALEETIKTYLCYRFALIAPDMSIDDKNFYRDKVVGAVINSLDKTPKEKGGENSPTYRQAALDNFIAGNHCGEKMQDAAFRQMVQTVMEEMPYAFVQLTSQVKDKRNDINHFGMRENAVASTALQNELKKLYAKFRALTEPTTKSAPSGKKTAVNTFVNFSNHPSADWGAEQRSAAKAYGKIVDVPFPSVTADADEFEIETLAQDCANKIFAMNPAAVMCQGEMSLTYAVAERLKNAGVTALAACSEHISEEEALPDGTTKRTSAFKFCRFRAY